MPYNWWAAEGRPYFDVLQVSAGAHVTLWASVLNHGKGLPLSGAYMWFSVKCPHRSCAGGESYPGYPWEPSPLDLTSIHEA